jgi:hypothetical protein
MVQMEETQAEAEVDGGALLVVQEHKLVETVKRLRQRCL